MASIPARALHYVFRIGNRGKNANFFRNILGMKVLRHEEFTEGCPAQCNGPFDNRWSKTMVGYGPESTHFVIELTYNYGVKSYELGNDFGGITIKSSDVIKRAKQNSYPIVQENDLSILISPDGYKFYIIDEPQISAQDPINTVILKSTNLDKTKHYWTTLLKMNLVDTSKNSILLQYSNKQVGLKFIGSKTPLKRAETSGRIAFAVPKNIQPTINDIIEENKYTILTPLVTLDTPGKATVRVIILSDPDEHEICFVDEEGFSELSKFDEEGNAMLDKYISKDPFQDKIA